MDKTSHEEMAQYFDGLSHPVRIHIVRLLLSQELHVLEINERIGHLQQPTISHHLRLLRKAHLVSFRRGNVRGKHGRRDGNYHYYFLCERERIQQTLESSGQPIAFSFSER